MTPESPNEFETFHAISSIEDDWLTVIRGQGELDYPVSDEFEDACRGALEANRRWLLIDFMDVDVDYFPPHVHDVLVGCAKMAKDQEGCLSVACDTPAVTKVFTIAGSAQLVNLRPTLEEARSLLETKRNASEA